VAVGAEVTGLADGYTGLVPVRDSKTPAARPLILAAVSWAVFVDGVKAGRFVHTFG